MAAIAFNPMVNAGAIAVSALFPGADAVTRRDAMLASLSRFAGRELEIDDAVYRSEAETGHRNRAIAWLMQNSGMLASEPDLALDTYFQQCSVLVDTRDLAMMAATLAAGGRNPRTGVEALTRAHVPDVLTVMLTCGMYDYAGQWAHEVGLPAKSGVSGGVVAVVPGQFGIAAWSPPLDAIDNSVRAVRAIKKVSERFGFHGLAARPELSVALRRELDGRAMRSRRWRPSEQMAALDEEATRIAVLELQGHVSVAAMERVLLRAAAVSNSGEAVLDLSRITGCDPGALVLLADAARGSAEAGRNMLVVVEALAEQFATIDGLLLRSSVDAALELAEDRILGDRCAENSDVAAQFFDAPFLARLTATEYDLLKAEVPINELSAQAGDLLAAAGEPADTVVVIGRGRARIMLPVEEGEAVCLHALGPGSTFGEMALMEDARRSADVIAETQISGWSMDVAEIRAFGERHPAILGHLLAGLAGDLSHRLRRTNDTIRMLKR